MKTRRSSPGLAKTILDLDYGDEQERSRYYELHSVIVRVAAILVPLVGALAVVGFGREAIGPVVAMVATFVIPMILGNLLYLNRYGVRSASIALSAKNRWYMTMHVATWTTFVVAVALELSGSAQAYGPWLVVGAVAVIFVALVTRLASTTKGASTKTNNEPAPVRLVQAILDLDYGDEQERSRYYELHSVIVHVVMILTPLVGSAVLVVAGPAATWPVLAMYVGWMVSAVFFVRYLQRYHVRVDAIAMSPTNRRYLGLYWASLTIFVIALGVTNWDRSPFYMLTMMSGGLAGGAAAIVAAAARARREEAAE